MKFRTPLRAASAGVLALSLGVAVAGGASASTARHQYRSGSRPALFVETDASGANSILSYRQASDGTISFAGSFLTGGEGGTSVNATADPLASQDGLVLANNGANLIAVNPGSDTITVFAVARHPPHRAPATAERRSLPRLDCHERAFRRGGELRRRRIGRRVPVVEQQARRGARTGSLARALQHDAAGLPPRSRSNKFHAQRPAPDRHDEAVNERLRRVLSGPQRRARFGAGRHGSRERPPVRIHLRRGR